MRKIDNLRRGAMKSSRVEGRIVLKDWYMTKDPKSQREETFLTQEVKRDLSLVKRIKNTFQNYWFNDYLLVTFIII
jgi:hypothetical protein